MLSLRVLVAALRRIGAMLSGQPASRNESASFRIGKRATLVDPSWPRHDHRMADAVITAPLEREPHWRAIWRNAFPFLVVGLVWEAVARAQVFPARLFPPLEAIGATFWRLTLSGIL